jgi:hypothetical protein
MMVVYAGETDLIHTQRTARSLSGLPGQVRERDRTIWCFNMIIDEVPCVTTKHTIFRQVSNNNTSLNYARSYTKTPTSLSSHKAEAKYSI